MSRTKFYSENWHTSAIHAGAENNKAVYLCAGNGSTKTPGKLINGNCYYANNGDEHKNTTYYMLVDEKAQFQSIYKWKKASTLTSGAEAVTSRDWDAGDYIYHCVASPYNSPNQYAGKYLPGTGKCYWSYYGDEKSTSDANTFSILVPR